MHSGYQRFEEYLELELAKIEQFFMRHGEFCRYYHLRESYMDDRIFIRDATENMMLDAVEVIMAEDFCVGCYWAAQLWANGELRGFLKATLAELRHPVVAEVGDAPELRWTDSQTDLVELAFGFQLKGSFNNGKATIKQVARWVEVHFGVGLGHIYNGWQEIRRRKKVRTKYVDEVRGKLLEKMEEGDE